MRAKEAGYTTLIGLLIATGIAAAAIPMMAEMQSRKMALDMASATGQDLAEFSVGLRGFIAAAQANPGLIPAGPMNGANWLKPAACGGLATNPPNGYIPCDFGNYGGNDTLFEASYLTTFVTSGPPVNYIEARTTFVPQVPANPRSRGMIADHIANAASAETQVPSNGMFINYMSNVPANATDLTARVATMNNPASPDFGRVLLIASNAPSNDLWLRTDGTNQMLAALNMGGNDLVNARGIQATGDMNLGGGASIGGDAVINQNLRVGQDGQIGQDLFVTRDTHTGRDLVAQRDIISAAGDIQATNGNLSASNGVSGDARGVVIGDDVYVTDMVLSNGHPPRMTQGVFEMRVVGAGAIVPRPTCPTGLGEPQIFASIQSIVPNNGAEMHGSRVQVANLGAAGWLITPQVLLAGIGWQQANSAQVVVSTKCN